MYFNVDEEIIKKHKSKFPDKLEKVANIYNEFEGNFTGDHQVVLQFNQNLKLFPIINSWRIESFFQWDLTRQSLICAKAVYEECCKKYNKDDNSEERIYFDLLAEYYIDNACYRMFSILEKVAHSINTLMNLELKKREVSFYKVTNIMNANYSKNKITKDISSMNNCLFESIKEYRNHLTHKMNLLQPEYELEDHEIEVDMKEHDVKKIKVNGSYYKEQEISLSELVKNMEKFYRNLTIFLENVFLASIKELKKRYSEEVEAHNKLLTLN